MAKDLGRHKSARRALIRGLFAALVKNGKVETSLPRARALKTFTDRILSAAKKGDVSARRLVAKKVAQDKTVVAKIFADVLPKLGKRTSGFTRIIKLGGRRGDNSPRARLEWVEGKKDVTKNVSTKGS